MRSLLVNCLRRQLGRFGLAAALLAAPAARAQEPSAVGTMPEDYLPGLKAVLQAALKQSPTMISNQIAIAQSETNVTVQDAAMIPQIYGGASYGVSLARVSEAGVASQTSNSKGLFYNAGISEPIFQWGAVFNQARIARIGVAISKRQYAEAYRSLLQQLRESYMGLISAKMNLRNCRLNQQQAEEALAVAQAQLKSGAIAPDAMSGPQLAAADAELTTDQTVAAYVHAKRALALMAGLAEIPEESIPDEIPKPAYSAPVAETLLADFLGDGVRNTIQAQIYEMNIRQATLNYRIAETNDLPKLSFNAGYSLSNENSIAGGTAGTPASVTQVAVQSENYGLGVSWNIFDGLRTLGEVRSALDNRRANQRSLSTYVDTTLEQAQDLERNVGFAARAMALAEIRDRYTAGSLRQTTAEFKFGSVSRATVDAAVANRYASEAVLDAARGDFLSRWCEFVSLVGADPLMNDLPISYVHVSR